MKNIKTFESFSEEGKTYDTHTFGPREHLEFCNTVSRWIEKNRTPVIWSLYADHMLKKSPNIEQSQRALTFWKKYVSRDRIFTLIEMDGKLIGTLHEKGDILMAYDETGAKVDPSVLSGLKFNEVREIHQIDPRNQI
jgi:hypothetical protein